jgi:hypothetical protein
MTCARHTQPFGALVEANHAAKALGMTDNGVIAVTLE